MTVRKAQFKTIASVSSGVVVLDQVSKAILRATVEAGVPPRDGVFFQFVNHQNTGIIGGAFSDLPLLAFAAPTAAFAILIYLFRHLNPVSGWQTCAYAVVLGGAVGNFIDRLVFRAVTDFLQFHFYFIPIDFPWKYYPAFNVADSAIVIGVGLLVLTWNADARKNATNTV